MTLLAAYVGYADVDNSATQATTTAEWNSLAAALGQTPTMMLTYIDFTRPIDDWTGDQQWAVDSWKASPWLAGVTPIIALPMAIAGDNADTDFKAIVAGTWDGALEGVFSDWANAGYKSLYLRPGWEMNGTWMPWSIDNGNAADFVAAFQHIANLAHAFSGAIVKVVWNPNVGNPSPAAVPVGNYYPGDTYVDIIGIDTYGAPVNADSSPSAISTGPADFTLKTALDFANAHGKPFALAETGGMDAAFPTNLASVVAASGVRVDYVGLWDASDPSIGNLVWSSISADAAAWRAAFATISGAPAAALGVATGSGSDTLALSISEDAYANGDGTSDANGDAAFTVSVDGTQLAGTFFVTAPKSAAIAESFIFKGDWAPGTHAVTVHFLNDAYGGSASSDRNLYVNDVTYDGTDIKQNIALYNSGTKDFSVTDSTATPSPAVGGGQDTLMLQVSEDAYKGNAQFTVSVDGKQLGGTFIATTIHSSGVSQSLTFKGDFGPDRHIIAVNFLNDVYGGTVSTDRNLYVDDIIYNGADTYQSAALMTKGPRTFSVFGGTTPSVSETGDHGYLTKDLSQIGTYTIGGDSFVLRSGNAASVTLGIGISQISFVGPGALTLTGGFGQATATADTGNNKFVAGAGDLDVTGGAGKDAYIYHASSGLLTLEDFSLTKGDTLTVDKSLMGSLHQASDGRGGTLLTFGTNASHGVDIHGLAIMPLGSILWK